MVRYHEMMLDDAEPTESLREKLKQSYNTESFSGIQTNNGVVIKIDGTLETNPGITELVDIKILEVNDFFMVRKTNLKNLLHSPLSVNDGIFIINNPLLESLEGLPKRWGSVYQLKIYGNPKLISLKGLEIGNNISGIMLEYIPNLPLLRLLLAKYVRFIVPGTSGKINEQYQNLENMINDHIKIYPNIKERIFKCQYAMIKAGYKDNAKW
jgi:hypothetical protein